MPDYVREYRRTQIEQRLATLPRKCTHPLTRLLHLLHEWRVLTPCYNAKRCRRPRRTEDQPVGERATMSIDAHMSPEHVLRAAEQLSAPELETLVAQILALRAQRAAPRLSVDETTLLHQINVGWPPAVQRHFDDLVRKRQRAEITPDELEELVRLTDQSEQRDARRLTALAALAHLRHVTLAEVMQTLGITPRHA